MTTDYAVEVLGPEHLPRLLRLFEASASACYCRYWHFGGTKNEWLDRCANAPDTNARELEAATRAGDPSAQGLVAVDASTLVVGWMKLTPRATLPKLRNLSVYRQLDLGDEKTTFSVGCLLVHPEHRERGVARRLLEAAPSFVRAWGGASVEGYPRRSSAPLYPEEAWQGPEGAFRKAGFEAIHDLPPYPVYRRLS